jgi:hypothetical protein
MAFIATWLEEESMLLRALTVIRGRACFAGATNTESRLRVDRAEFVSAWKISKQFPLDVANAMPGELYNFKPNPEEMTFGEQMAHIAGANVFRFQRGIFHLGRAALTRTDER